MNRSIKSLTSALAITISLAFTSGIDEGVDITYGVSESDPSGIELHLTKNFEFTYQDFSNPDDKIQVQGTYTMKNEKIELVSDTDEVKFHNKWTLSDSRMKAKSRKGISFYSLHKL